MVRRVTLVLCANATGTIRVPPLLIGSSKQPFCFRRHAPPIPYTNQKNAWMDQHVMQHWFDTVFVPYVKRHFGSRKVLLLLDNCSGHGGLVNHHANIVIRFLPPNCTSKHQPMDQGIIAYVKNIYKRMVAEALLDVLENWDDLRELGKSMKPGTAGLSFRHPAHLMDAAQFVNEIWSKASDQLFINCFNKANIWGPLHTSALAALSDKQFKALTKGETVDSICAMFSALSVQLPPGAAAASEAAAAARGPVPVLLDTVLLAQPGQSTSPATVQAAVQRWLGLEDEDEILDAMRSLALEAAEKEAKQGAAAAAAEAEVESAVEEEEAPVAAAAAPTPPCSHEDFVRHLQAVLQYLDEVCGADVGSVTVASAAAVARRQLAMRARAQSSLQQFFVSTPSEKQLQRQAQREAAAASKEVQRDAAAGAASVP